MFGAEWFLNNEIMFLDIFLNSTFNNQMTILPYIPFF